MSWKDIYKSRTMTPQQAARLIKSGDSMYTPLGLGQPSMAIELEKNARERHLLFPKIF